MKRTLRGELLIFSLILGVMALILHPDLLSNPFERFESMCQRENYFHPVVYTLIPYTALLILRYLSYSIKRLFARD